MKIKDAVRWNIGASVVYAAGIWTMIGYYGYMKYTGGFEQSPQKESREEEVVQDENTVVYTTPHTKTFIVYKQDFVPYTTRIYNFFRPPGPERPRTGSGGELMDGADEASRRV